MSSITEEFTPILLGIRILIKSLKEIQPHEEITAALPPKLAQLNEDNFKCLALGGGEDDSHIPTRRRQDFPHQVWGKHISSPTPCLGLGCKPEGLGMAAAGVK